MQPRRLQVATGRRDAGWERASRAAAVLNGPAKQQKHEQTMQSKGTDVQLQGAVQCVPGDHNPQRLLNAVSGHQLCATGQTTCGASKTARVSTKWCMWATDRRESKASPPSHMALNTMWWLRLAAVARKPRTYTCRTLSACSAETGSPSAAGSNFRHARAPRRLALPPHRRTAPGCPTDSLPPPR